LIDRAYRLAESVGLSLWTQDEAGPFQTIPYAGHTWRPEGQPRCQPHEYVRNGTAKVLTLFHPITGQVQVQGVTSCTNAVLHAWLKKELGAILDALPPVSDDLDPETNRAVWESWRAGLDNPPPLADELPRLRMLLIWDNLTGHKTPSMVEWLNQHGVMPLYTPLGGSWLNMTESIQRILKRRALDGQHPTEPEEIMSWFEAVARGWNRDPTPFEWGGRRAARRVRSRQRRHALGGSAAYTRRPVPRPRRTTLEKWQSTCQVTH
jgi:transposase